MSNLGNKTKKSNILKSELKMLSMSAGHKIAEKVIK